MLGFLGALPFPVVLLIGTFLIWMCVHAVRTRQNYYWIWIILVMAPPIGALVYFFAIALPDLMGGSAGRAVGKAARETFDPGGDYRRAKALYEDAPTAQNILKLADAACRLGRWAEGEQLYGQALQGVHADDPALILGRAQALLELGRPQDALVLLDSLQALGEADRPLAVLARARALHAVGRLGEADQAYQNAVNRVPGLEALARYAVFQSDAGRNAEARETLAEVDRRAGKAKAHFRREARAWRDFAAQHISA